MTMRPLLAVAIAAGLIAAVPAFAQDLATPTAKSEMSKTKTQKTAKAKKIKRPSSQSKANDNLTSSPYYSTQKDEMTR